MDGRNATTHTDAQRNQKCPPLFLRRYTIVPTVACAPLWQDAPRTHACDAHDIPRLYEAARTAYGFQSAGITKEHYDRARAENTPGRGMYPQWVMDIATLADRVDTRVIYCVEQKLYGARVLWPGLPCLGRTIEEEALGDTTHPRFVGKAMIGVVELEAPSPGEEPYEWVFTLACGRMCIAGKKRLRRLIATDMLGRHAPHLRHKEVLRAVGRTKQERRIPYMPGWFHYPNSRKTVANSETSRSKMADLVLLARKDNAAMFESRVSRCKALAQCGDATNDAKRRKTAEDPSSCKSSHDVHMSDAPAPTDTSDRADSKTRPAVDTNAAVHYMTQCIAAATAKLKGDKDAITRGSCKGTIVPADPAEASKFADAFVHFLWYYEHYFKHMDVVQAHPLLGKSDAPGDGVPANFVRTPQFVESLKLFIELFVACDKQQ